MIETLFAVIVFSGTSIDVWDFIVIYGRKIDELSRRFLDTNLGFILHIYTRIRFYCVIYGPKIGKLQKVSGEKLWFFEYLYMDKTFFVIYGWKIDELWFWENISRFFTHLKKYKTSKMWFLELFFDDELLWMVLRKKIHDFSQIWRWII